MQKTRDEIQKIFSAELQTEARRRYRGKIPSAAAFAAHFNLQLRDHRLDISQETARRWLRGHCLPDLFRLRILARWLGLDLNRALSCVTESAEPADEATRCVTRFFQRIAPERRGLALNMLKWALPEVAAQNRDIGPLGRIPH